MAAGDSTRRNTLATGQLVGTGSAISVNCGFKPLAVTIFNTTTKTNGEWVAEMPDAHAQITVDSGAGTTDTSFITSAGITPTYNGFTLGTNASLNASSDVIYWKAQR